MSIHVICAGKYNESIYKRLDCEITPYVYKNKCGWVAPNNVSRWEAFRGVKVRVPPCGCRPTIIAQPSTIVV